jgi:hypothetical protein
MQFKTLGRSITRVKMACAMRERDFSRPVHGKCKAVGERQKWRSKSIRVKCPDASFRRCCGRLKNATDDDFCELWWTWQAPAGKERDPANGYIGSAINYFAARHSLLAPTSNTGARRCVAFLFSQCVR